MNYIASAIVVFIVSFFIVLIIAIVYEGLLKTPKIEKKVKHSCRQRGCRLEK